LIDVSSQLNSSALRGQANTDATAAYAKRIDVDFKGDFYNRTASGLTVSSIGIGTYKGADTDEADESWGEAIAAGLRGGINVIDAAIRYRRMRSEKRIGRVMRQLVKSGDIERSEIFLSSKAGLIGIPSGRDPDDYIDREIVQHLNISESKIYRRIHCLEPAFFEHQLATSLENLGVETIDCYFVHNPELNTPIDGADATYARLRDIFELLEQAIADGRIGAYGIATWNGMRRKAGSAFRMDFERVLEIARQVGGPNHGFRYAEVPLSIGMPHTFNDRTGDGRRTFQVLADQGVDVLTSASVYEGNIEKLFNLNRLHRLAGVADSENDLGTADVSLPISENSIAQLFEVLLAARQQGIDLKAELVSLNHDMIQSIYPAALNLVRSQPLVTSALVGMESSDFVRDHLTLARTAKINAADSEAFLDALSLTGTATETAALST
jgi:aryl-alcohol dehydrogenase-like predicted oxidoreductase